MTMEDKKGLIQVYTGDGKGKTTAALGLAVRAVGAGLKVAVVYFDKGGDHYSERTALAERFKGDIDVFAAGLDRFDPKAGTFRFGVAGADKAEAERGIELARGLMEKNEHDLLILDEILTSASLGMLTEQQLLGIVRSKPPEMELVLTGRDCPASVIELSDLVSEMRPVKHYYESGTAAREGIDY